MIARTIAAASSAGHSEIIAKKQRGDHRRAVAILMALPPDVSEPQL
jgi:hypothetical protein